MAKSLHAKYPSMERQDLSQSQLGAFKFIPVDGDCHYSPQPVYPLTFNYNQTMQNPGNMNFQHEMVVKSPHLENNVHHMKELSISTNMCTEHRYRDA